MFSRPLKYCRQFDLTLKIEVVELEGMCIDRNVEYVSVGVRARRELVTLLARWEC